MKMLQTIGVSVFTCAGFLCHGGSGTWTGAAGASADVAADYFNGDNWEGLVVAEGRGETATVSSMNGYVKLTRPLTIGKINPPAGAVLMGDHTLRIEAKSLESAREMR